MEESMTDFRIKLESEEILIHCLRADLFDLTPPHNAVAEPVSREDVDSSDPEAGLFDEFSDFWEISSQDHELFMRIKTAETFAPEQMYALLSAMEFAFDLGVKAGERQFKAAAKYAFQALMGKVDGAGLIAAAENEYGDNFAGEPANP
jgi:hypothetical protein